MSTTNIHTPLTVPDVPVVQSDLIVTPAEIADNFKEATNSFECYRVLQEIFLHYVHSGGFNRMPDEKRNHFCNCMQIISEAIFSLERHAQAWDAGTLIMKYMETVYEADDDEMARVVASLREIDRKYGNLRHGLEALLEHKDGMDMKRRSVDGWPGMSRAGSQQHNENAADDPAS